MPSNVQEVIWIIGASSGIGKALARTFAKNGAQLILSARREELLRQLAEEINVDALPLPFDVTNLQEFEKSTQLIQEKHPKIDRIIFLAGAYDPMPLSDLKLEKVGKIIDINLMGAFNCVKCCYPLLLEQNSGQIAFCGSVAGYNGLPNGQPYSATKAALTNLTETLAAEAPKMIDVKLISPGFVKTDLTAKNEFDMPFILSPEDAADRIFKGLHKNGFEVTFPKRLSYLLKGLQLLPYALRIYLLRKISPKKN